MSKQRIPTKEKCKKCCCRHRKGLLKQDTSLPWPLAGVHEERSDASRPSGNWLCYQKASEGKGIFHKLGQFSLH